MRRSKVQGVGPGVSVLWVGGAAMVGMALTASLGFWQLGRAGQKQAWHAALQAQADLPELPASALGQEGLSEAEQAQQVHRWVTVQGVWRTDATVYLENRPLNKQAGFIVLTPLMLDGGPDAILVQRGWIPRHMRDRTAIAPYQTPEGRVSVRGRVAPWPSHRMELGTPAGGPIRLNVAKDEWMQSSGLRLRPVTIQESPAATAPDGLVREWPEPSAEVHKHFAYAAQWFGLSALILGLWVWLQWAKPYWRAKRSSAVKRAIHEA